MKLALGALGALIAVAVVAYWSRRRPVPRGDGWSELALDHDATCTVCMDPVLAASVRIDPSADRLDR